MKRTLLLLATFAGSVSFGQVADCSELFISEYVEGWSNNKALEIYNPTDNAIDLSAYMVIRFSNGATTATAANAVQLNGTVAAHDVYVGVLEKLDPNGTGQEAPVWDSLQARADGFYCPVYNTSNAFYWNGNDAVVLAKGTTSDIPNAILVDVFGKIGEDPGVAWTSGYPYTGNGDIVTQDHSMIRKFGIKKGEINPTISFFDPLLEYDSIPAVVDIGGQLYGNWFSLGTHDCECNSLGVKEESKAKVAVFPNPSNGEFYVNGAADFSNIVVMNSLGQVVRTISNNAKQLLVFDLSDRRGVYFVKLSDEDGNSVTKRVIVK